MQKKKVLKITQNYSALAEFISLGQVVPALKCFFKEPNEQVSCVVGLVASGPKCHLISCFLSGWHNFHKTGK